ncbi:MAG TPA: hypothetical protein VGR38_12970 [Candidatus Polarisedimenticolia bacterium]|nr:hypothetical protein [Candidatus Polarisedimenticolia bacterium]
MKPIVLIHGYSAERGKTGALSIASIYGTLPRDLRSAFGRGAVVEIDLARYLSLEDGVRLDDISRAMQRALEEEHPDLLKKGFDGIVHSTGALVIRNWVRRFSPRPSPLGNLIHLAGANFGSGWAHIGKGQLAKWGRRVFQGGAERGLQILDALELGSSWTLDLHLHFLREGFRMLEDYGVRESVVVGSQADAQWFEFPIRYAKEDGSDGVVRVSAASLSYQYLKLGPTIDALALGWNRARAELGRHLERRGRRQGFYEIQEATRPGLAGRGEVPLAIPYGCAHSGEKMGIVTGSGPREEVLRLIRKVLQPGSDPAENRASLVEAFRAETEDTYRKVLAAQAPSAWRKWIDEPRAQYDRHAQVILRIRDQDGRPVPDFDIFFDSVRVPRDPSRAMKDLIEDKHVNSRSPHIITFYLRTDAFSAEAGSWIPRVPELNGCILEISAVESQTKEILYLPLRFGFTPEELEAWIVGDRTTVIDVELLRLPSPSVFSLARF